MIRLKALHMANIGEYGSSNQNSLHEQSQNRSHSAGNTTPPRQNVVTISGYRIALQFSRIFLGLSGLVVGIVAFMMTYPTFMTAGNHLPATRALERAKQALSQAPSTGLVAPKASAESMITKNSLKRSRSMMGSFQLDDLLQATAPVEESIAFPSIEWNFDDDDEEEADESGNVTTKHELNDFPSIDFPSIDFPQIGAGFPSFGRTRVLPSLERVLERDEDEDDDEDDYCHRTKRVCRGLVRSKKIETNMASLADLLSGTSG